MNRWFNTLTVEKPVIVQISGWGKHIKSNLMLFTICCIALSLHLYPISFPILILGDETIHLQGGLWIYQYIDNKWHSFFQIAFWGLIVLLISLRKKKGIGNFILNKFNSTSGSTRDNSRKYSIILLSIGFLTVYFLLLQNMSYTDTLVRYPPVSKFIYFITYSLFGINRISPRIVQLIFYLLCAVYLYRTICLFYEKETALLGASIYLFLPITFAYAHLGELVSGTIFFIIAISFYFIRFIKDGDDRDLVLAAFLIGIGFLYKKPLLLMFFICFIFLVFQNIKKRDYFSLIHVKILILSLIPVIPWMIISKFFSWRNFTVQLSNLTSLDNKIVPYFLLMSSNLSEIVFILSVIACLYVCFFQRNTLTVFFGLVFVVYFFIVVSDMAALSPRFSMMFYPTIVVFLSLFISRVIQKIRWRHAFKLCFIVLTTYLIIICAVAPFNKRFLTIMDRKLYYFPSDKAMKWVKDNVREDEKILTMRIMSALFYRDKYEIDRNKLIHYWYQLDDFSSQEKLRTFYKKNKITYIMIPYNKPYATGISLSYLIIQRIKDDADNELLEVAKFSQDENYIYIYKLKESS